MVLNGVGGLSVLGGGAADGAALRRIAAAGHADVVVADLRTDVLAAQVVVAPCDVRGLNRGLDPARLVIRVSAPVSRTEAGRALGSPPRGFIDDDPRVRRAAMSARVPSGVPGRWARDTSAAVAGVEVGRRRLRRRVRGRAGRRRTPERSASTGRGAHRRGVT